jgi:hypothetical protein
MQLSSRKNTITSTKKQNCVKSPFRIEIMGVGTVNWARADINFIVTQWTPMLVMTYVCQERVSAINLHLTHLWRLIYTYHAWKADTCKLALKTILVVSSFHPFSAVYDCRQHYRSCSVTAVANAPLLRRKATCSILERRSVNPTVTRLVSHRLSSYLIGRVGRIPWGTPGVVSLTFRLRELAKDEIMERPYRQIRNRM